MLPARRCQRLIYFDPGLVNRVLGKYNFNSKLFILDGDWDQTGTKSIDYTAGTAKTIHQLFVEEKPHFETVQYKRMKEAIESGHPEPKKLGAYWCKTIEDIDEYFTRLIKAYKQIKAEGYKSQGELAAENPGTVDNLKDEILLYIDRNGELILGRGGTHRFFIAKLLALPSVPGLLMGVHKQWAKNCHKHYGLKSLEASIEKGIKSITARQNTKGIDPVQSQEGN